MSKIIEFIDKVVEFPLRWTANIGGSPENITDLTRDPGTVYQAGTANKAEFFNAIQENGVFSVESTINIAGNTTTYTLTEFETDGTFNIFEGFKISMKAAGSNIGITKINLLGDVYDVKIAISGSYLDTTDRKIETNEIVTLEYNNGVFILKNSQYLKTAECPFPVNSIYLTTSTLNPSTIWENTTWAAMSDGKFLMNDHSKVPLSEGGSNIITTGNMPLHSHTRGSMEITGSVYSGGSHGLIQQSSGSTSGAFTKGTARGRYIEGFSSQSWDLNFKASDGWTGSTSATGSGEPYTQPYIACRMWVRLT